MSGGRIPIALVAVLAGLPVCLLACSGGSKAPPSRSAPEEISAEEPASAEILPAAIGTTGWVRKPEVSVFVGDSLFEYINGAAEMYHKYGFVDLHAAEYEKGEAIITADLYRFPDSDLAYGMFTTLRPDEPDTVTLGVEGFAYDTNWIYVKGPYLANVYTYDDVDMDELWEVAATIEGGLHGTIAVPAAFGLFPRDGRVRYSEKIYAEAFLSQEALSYVYAVDYGRDGRRVTLFLSDDPGSKKLNAWRAAAEEVHDPDMGYQHLPYDGSRYLHARDSYRGEIIAGPINGRLAGMVGYSQEDMEILLAWLHAIAEQP